MNMNGPVNPDEGINATINNIKTTPMSDLDLKEEIEAIEIALYDQDQPPISEGTRDNVNTFFSEVREEVNNKKTELYTLLKNIVNKSSMKIHLTEIAPHELRYFDPYSSYPPNTNMIIPYFRPLLRESGAHYYDSGHPDFKEVFENIKIIKDINDRLIYHIRQYLSKLLADYNIIISDLLSYERALLPYNPLIPDSPVVPNMRARTHGKNNSSGTALDSIINFKREELDFVKKEMNLYQDQLNLLNADYVDHNELQGVAEDVFQQKMKAGNRTIKGGSKKKRNKTKYRKRKH